MIVVGGKDLDHVAAHAEGPPAEVAFGTLVEDLDQLAGDVLAPYALSLFQEQQHAVIGFGRAQAIDAAHGGDDHAIAPLEQRPGGREPQLVQFVVDGGFLFDIDVGGGNVGFRLIIVVIGDKIFDRVVGEELFEFVVKLRRQGFVMGQHQRRTVERPR